jgi:hypothetical protein
MKGPCCLLTEVTDGDDDQAGRWRGDSRGVRSHADVVHGLAGDLLNTNDSVGGSFLKLPSKCNASTSLRELSQES